MALLGCNLGVEIGQLVIVALVFPIADHCDVHVSINSGYFVVAPLPLR